MWRRWTAFAELSPCPIVQTFLERPMTTSLRSDFGVDVVESLLDVCTFLVTRIGFAWDSLAAGPLQSHIDTGMT